jgi:hypothetical protein
MTTGKLAAWGLPMRIAALEPRVTRIASRPRQSLSKSSEIADCRFQTADVHLRSEFCNLQFQ